MRTGTLGLLAFFLAGWFRPALAGAQDAGASNPLDRIVDAALANGRSHELLRSLCTVAPHRLSGSEGAARAVLWAQETMTALGFDNVRLEPVTVPVWVRGQVEDLVITAPAELAGETLPLLALGGSVATPPEGVEAGVIVVRSFDELAGRAAEAEGKLVLFNRPLEDTEVRTFRAYGGAVEQRVDGANHAARVGALGALVRSMTMRRDDVPHTGGMRYADDVKRVPTAAVSTNAADQLAALVESGVDVRVRLRLSCRTLPDAESFNVIGELVGSELPDEIVVVGGHLDSWDVGQGAHDDGAGCVQSIEALRLLDQLDLRPRRTLRCVLFMNEENGLNGGRGYHVAHEEEMPRHVLAIESDRGAFTPRGFVVQAPDETREALARLVDRLDRMGPLIVRPGGGGPDIGPMAESGVPLVGYLPDPQRYFDFHHSERDVFAAVHPRELALGAAAIASLAWLVADGEGLPGR